MQLTVHIVSLLLTNTLQGYKIGTKTVKYSNMHCLINYIDTKAKCRHLKKMICKETLRYVFIRVYRLEIQSVILVFSTKLYKQLPI